MKIEYISKQVRQAAMRKIIPYVAAVLKSRKDRGEDYKDIAIRCGINPPRVSEVLTGLLNFNDLQRLVRGGYVELSKILEQPNLTEEEKILFSNMVSDSREIQTAAKAALAKGYKLDQIAKAIWRMLDEKVQK